MTYIVLQIGYKVLIHNSFIQCILREWRQSRFSIRGFQADLTIIHFIRVYKLSVAAVANPSNNLIPTNEGEHLIFQSQLTTFSRCFIKGPGEEFLSELYARSRERERETVNYGCNSVQQQPDVFNPFSFGIINHPASSLGPRKSTIYI